jgi:hypothetical protein
MLTTSQNYVTYLGNGATTSFPFNFYVQQASFLVVTITNNNVSPPVTTVLNSSQYSVTGIGTGNEFSGGSGAGGTVTYPVSGSPLPTGWTITIQRVVPYVQNTSLTNQGSFYPNVVEAALDYLMCGLQQLNAAATGFTALQGPAGNTIWSGTSAPGAGIGNNGDFYINTATWVIYGPKAGGSWPSGQSILGATGSSGNTIWNGTSAPSNAVGANGDFYINTATSTIYGPKAAGAWPAGVSLVGATGATGQAGATGISWQGIYSPTTAYTQGQGVSYNGIGYVALSSTTGNAPTNTSYWAAVSLSTNRNRLINGEMRIDMRHNGLSQTVAVSDSGDTLYRVDRWAVTATGANITAIQYTLGSGQWKNSLRLTEASSNTGFSVYQRILSNNSYDLAGGTVTLSVYLASSTLTSIGYALYYPNSMDAWGASTSIASGSFNISSTLTQYSVVIALPANVINGLSIVFTGANFTSGTFDVTGAQLEPGSNPTPFDRRPDDIERQRCFPYCPVWSQASSAYASGMWLAQPASTSSMVFNIIFPVPVRIAPTGAVMTGTTQYLTYNDATYGTGSSTLSIDNASVISARILNTGCSGFTASNTAYTFTFTSNSDVLYLTGCEL